MTRARKRRGEAPPKHGRQGTNHPKRPSVAPDMATISGIIVEIMKNKTKFLKENDELPEWDWIQEGSEE